MKKLAALLCMFACILSLAACGQSDDTDYASLYDEELLVETTQYIITTLEATDTSTIEEYVALHNADIADTDEEALEIKASYQSWLDSIEELGSYVGSDDDYYTFECDEDGATVVLYVTFENRQAKLTGYYDWNSTLTSFFIEPIYSTAENIQSGVMNTIIGMVTVFAVLLFIAFIIYLFKYINKAETYFTNRKAEKELAKKGSSSQGLQTTSGSAAVPAAAAAAEPEEGPVIDDTELVAVIMAAIAADLDTSVDTLVVRSIRRRSTNNWQKA